MFSYERRSNSHVQLYKNPDNKRDSNCENIVDSEQIEKKISGSFERMDYLCFLESTHTLAMFAMGKQGFFSLALVFFSLIYLF